MLKIEDIKELIKTIDDSSLSEFTYETNETSITLKKAQAVQAVSEVQQVPIVQQVEVENENDSSETIQEQGNSEVKMKEQEIDFDYEIVSPMVGTLYSAATPESDPYVSVGTSVNEESIVCIIEAMKLFNEIVAEINGEVVEVLVEDGELVEFGQPLFRVKTK